MAQRIASTPAKYVCDQAMLPSAQPIRASGSHTAPCQRSGSVRERCAQKNRVAAISVPQATIMDLSVSCSISSLGTPSAGASTSVRAITTVAPPSSGSGDP
jgi:hypothetical protein